MKFPEHLDKKIEARTQNLMLRRLKSISNKIDFCSNDYLGFANSEQIFHSTNNILKEYQTLKNGSGASRLISGNHELYIVTEKYICQSQNAESATIFNSGYDANIGFWECVPQKGDIVFFDEFSHASIRDGLRLSNAQKIKFKHNDFDDLSQKLEKLKSDGELVNEIYIATESVFSMDGDVLDLKTLVQISEKYNCKLVIDEAHAIGVLGVENKGLVYELNVQSKVFATIITFGKALGCHGAAILGSEKLKTYLVNFARSLIYTTALPPHSLANILASFQFLENDESQLLKTKLNQNTNTYLYKVKTIEGDWLFSKNNSPIQTFIVSGNEKVLKIANDLQNKGFDVKPILSPTVKVGTERLRICLHSFNSPNEIEHLIDCIIETIENE
jgi:8-amino-7-oxononanoate synthase